MKTHYDRIAFVFGGISTEHASSLEMLIFLRDELLRQPLPASAPEFYLLQLDGSVRFFRSIDALPESEFQASTAGKLMSRSELVATLADGNAFLFSLVQGSEGEDGLLQGLVGFLDIPSNLGSVASACHSIDKWMFALAANELLSGQLRPIRTLPPKAAVDPIEVASSAKHFRTPEFVMKPNRQGASVLFETSTRLRDHDLQRLAATVAEIEDRLLIQESVRGREVTCGCLCVGKEWRSLGCMSVEPASGFMSRAEKSGRAPYSRKFIVSQDPIAMRIESISLALAAHFDFHTLCRFDFIVDEAGDIHLLEANSKPGLLRGSLFVAMLQNAGLSLHDLIAISIDNECDHIERRLVTMNRVKQLIDQNGEFLPSQS